MKTPAGFLPPESGDFANFSHFPGFFKKLTFSGVFRDFRAFWSQIPGFLRYLSVFLNNRHEIILLLIFIVIRGVIVDTKNEQKSVKKRAKF